MTTSSAIIYSDLHHFPKRAVSVLLSVLEYLLSGAGGWWWCGKVWTGLDSIGPFVLAGGEDILDALGNLFNKNCSIEIVQ